MAATKQYEARPMAWSVGPKDEPHHSEMLTTIRIDDEGAGEFVVVEQVGLTDIGKVCFDVEEWPIVRATIDAAIKSCRD